MVCFVQMQRFHPVPALDRLHPLRTPVLNEEVTVFQIIPSSLTLHCARNRSCGSAIGVSSWRRGRFRKCMSGNAIEDIFLSERWGTCNMGDRWSNQNGMTASSIAHSSTSQSFQPQAIEAETECQYLPTHSSCTAKICPRSAISSSTSRHFSDCHNFLFYILTDADSQRDHVLEFFSKEKYSTSWYDVRLLISPTLRI
ncbi:hypothetical protein BKA82DRAFT_2991064 [Pisolithus tinctorius]|nr:hypothetical protein BKA82DRAFT_2991064 [Pisolithus tinctorius]